VIVNDPSRCADTERQEAALPGPIIHVGDDDAQAAGGWHLQNEIEGVAVPLSREKFIQTQTITVAPRTFSSALAENGR
jgi:hypothetical protein